LNTQEIKHKFETLKKLDKSLRRFGARNHKYESHPVSEDEIRSFENKFNLTLPVKQV
jgi:hypothetical protein